MDFNLTLGMKILIGILLYLTFFLLFFWMRSRRVIGQVLSRTAESLDARSRQRVQAGREYLSRLQERTGVLYRIEQKLTYSGLTVKWSWLTPELWVLLNIMASALGYFAAALWTGKWTAGLAAILVSQCLRSFCLGRMMSRNFRLVNDNLLKFLDFLGNYSITNGEVTSVLNQISRYLDEPLHSVLDACYYEAQTTGDTSLALLSMAEKVEHPKFKELVRNMEISVRYSADFVVLVNNSRRAVREYMRTRQERRALVREAIVNMVILLAMSAVILLAVGQLIGIGIQEILFGTMPGRICLGVIAGIFALMYGQIRRMDR